jgi:hypothetical protein
MTIGLYTGMARLVFALKRALSIQEGYLNPSRRLSLSERLMQHVPMYLISIADVERRSGISAI